MNHLLHQISWHQYLTAAIIPAIIYYLLVILRCYRPALQNLQKRLAGHEPNDQLQALQYQPAEETTAIPAQNPGKQPHHLETVTETDILAAKLRACITRAAGKPFSPAALIPQLKQLLQEHTEPAAIERPVVNHLIVSECEKTGTALLTEEEVDQWWKR